MERTYICIDLKSFYASVECSERGLDPFTTDLVVADPTRSKGTICLAITPAMKAKGIKNRCRIHEIPPGMEYITAMPRMQLYIDYSSNIYATYLQFIAPEDIHVYSIDECFIDATDYLKLYQMTAREFALLLIGQIMKETQITSSVGIGTNLYLAKIAMDITAKKRDDHIGYLDERAFREKLWGHTPLTDFWMIGSGTARTLARFGVRTMGDLAELSLHSERFLFKQFGIDAELLIDHAWGIEPCTMADIHAYEPKGNSLSSGQVFMRNYSFEESLVILREMTDQLALELIERQVVTATVSVWLAYDHRSGRTHDAKSMTLPSPTSSAEKLIAATREIFFLIADRYTAIRRVGICFARLQPETHMQFDLFTDPQKLERERRLALTVLSIRRRYGKNAILKGSNLLECSTLRERNDQIGGHRA